MNTQRGLGLIGSLRKGGETQLEIANIGFLVLCLCLTLDLSLRGIYIVKGVKGRCSHELGQTGK